jgi:hypothetical protein
MMFPYISLLRKLLYVRGKWKFGKWKIELHFKRFVLWTMLLPIIRGQVYWMCGGGGIILLSNI